MRVGIVWNPSKIDEEELRNALDEALEEVFGADDLDGEAEARDEADGTDDESDDDRPEVRWFETSEDDPGQGAASDALEYECELVIAAGGDGTVRAVAERLGRSGSPAAELGIVPLGTGNLLARNLGIPLGDPVTALVRALGDGAEPIDLGMVRFEDADGNERRIGFVVMVGFGIDAQMIAETDDDLKEKAGWLAYVESLGRAISASDVVEFSLALDGGSARTEQAHTLLVANCGTLQGGITLLPDASPDDGELDLLVLRAEDTGSWLDTMRNLVWDNGLKRLATGGGAAESSRSTSFLRARTARVELPEPRHFEVDGDGVGEVSWFEAQILPAALLVR